GSASGNDGVMVAAKSGAVQAHAVFSSHAETGDWETTVWLLNEEGRWRVNGFYAARSSLIGRSPDDVLQLARKERDQGRAFDAAMLYSGLESIMYRGPAFQLGVVKSAQEDLKAFKEPNELQGKPPYHWTFGKAEYAVAQVSIVGQDGVF